MNNKSSHFSTVGSASDDGGGARFVGDGGSFCDKTSVTLNSPTMKTNKLAVAAIVWN